MYRVPATRQIAQVIERLRRRRTPVLFDVDDLIFEPEACRRDPRAPILPAEEAASGSRACTATAPPWRCATGSSAARRCCVATRRRSPGCRPSGCQRHRSDPRSSLRRSTSAAAAAGPAAHRLPQWHRHARPRLAPHRAGTGRDDVEARPTSSCGPSATSPSRPRSSVSAIVSCASRSRTGSSSRAAPRPRRQPRPPRAGRSLQRGEERDQVAGGRAGGDADHCQPDHAVPRRDRRRPHGPAGRRRRPVGRRARPAPRGQCMGAPDRVAPPTATRCCATRRTRKGPRTAGSSRAAVRGTTRARGNPPCWTSRSASSPTNSSPTACGLVASAAGEPVSHAVDAPGRWLWWRLFGLLALLGTAWALMMPLFGVPDEPAHVIKAAAAARASSSAAGSPIRGR